MAPQVPSARRARWAEVSACLDELLELGGDERAVRLAALRQADPELAGEVQALLDELPGVERDRFLEQPALPPGLALALGLGDDALAGRTIGPYTLERELGEGGMGSVWLARRNDGRYDGTVAVKFLHGGLASAASAERFAHEGRILARLAHPNIARLLDAGVLDGVRPYLMLEYVDGQPIDRYCESAGLDVPQRLALFLDVLAAVAHAHHRLILHRDLKPSNVLVTADAQVKLLDFGIAKLLDENAAPEAADLTRRAGRAFTPQYAAPEQLQDGEVTTATDVYALGVMLFALLSGQHPTRGRDTSVLEQMRAVVEAEPARLSEVAAKAPQADAARRARALRGDLDNIVAKALRKSPGERYANAEALAEDLRRHLRHEPVHARPDSAAYRLGKFVRRYRAGVAAGTATLLALGVGIGVALWQAREARDQHAKAEGLIEFMLGDLRRRLEPVGRLDVLDAVGEKALDHYEGQDLGRLSADALGRRARALHLIGEIAEQRGQLDEAARLFQRAADSTEALLARSPNDAQRVFDHAQSVYWVGYMARKRGESIQAADAFRGYVALAERLVRLDPAKADWRAEQAMALNNLGVVQLEGGQPREALALFHRVREAWAGLVTERPDLSLELAHTWGWIAQSHEALGDDAAALQALESKLQALQPIDEGRGHDGAALVRSTTHYDIAKLALNAGDAKRAAESAAAGVALLEKLSADDPGNLNRRQRLAFQRLGLVDALLALGRRPQALAHWQHLKADAAKVMQGADAGDITRQLRLAGWMLVMQHRLEGSLPDRALAAYLAQARGFEAAGSLGEADNLRVLLQVLLAAGDEAHAQGHASAAARHWGEALRLSGRAPARVSSPLLALQAHLAARLGDLARARSLASGLPDSYRHPVRADLQERLAAAAGGRPVTSNP